MKRMGNLYENTYKFENIEKVFREICRNTENKAKVQRFRAYKTINITRIHDVLEKRAYVPGPYNRFIIYEPKEREIVSQSMFDKAVNHLVSRHILMPALLPSLIDQNVASRPKMGTKDGIMYFQKYRKICNTKYKNYYLLKCDISKYFFSIDHDILKEKLKIKYYVRYQDDFLLFHESKEYLKYCLEEIRKFVEKEKLKLNPKTRIYKNTNHFLFLGRKFNGRYGRYKTIRKKIRKRKYLFDNGKINLNEMCGTIVCYNSLDQKKNYG